MNRRRRGDEGSGVWCSDSTPMINLLAKHKADEFFRQYRVDSFVDGSDERVILERQTTEQGRDEIGVGDWVSY